MGKTWRRCERHREGGAHESVRRLKRDAQPEVVTPEWAVERIADHVEYALDGLVGDGVIADEERDCFRDMINRRVRARVVNYDPDLLTDNGRTCSAVHFLTIVVDSGVLNIRQWREHDVLFRSVPIVALSEEEAQSCGYVSDNSARMSDGCRNVRDLEFRLDVNTLTGLLTKQELKVLSMRLGGYSNTEIGDEIGCIRQTVEKRILPQIRRKARLCGFIPPSEVRKGCCHDR